VDSAIAALPSGGGDMFKADNLSGLANTTTALTNLGGTTIGEALFTAVDAPAALSTVGGINSDTVAANLVVNPQFQIDQFGAGAGITTADNAYFADVYRYLGEASATTYAMLPVGKFSSRGLRIKAGFFR
jgi:hypothetical protein